MITSLILYSWDEYERSMAMEFAEVARVADGSC